MKRFISKVVSKALGFYVYAYVDPRDDSMFYIGKGVGDRVIASLHAPRDSKLGKRIAAIRSDGHEPIVEVLAHGLPNEDAAFHLEQVVIDVLGLPKLENLVKGHRSSLRGRASLDDLVARYEVSEVEIQHEVLIIRINQLYRYGMTAVELYDATRGVWKLGLRRENARFALAVYAGIVKEVYEICDWYPAGSTFSSRSPHGLTAAGRWEFVGRIASPRIRNRYMNKSVKTYFKPNSQSPLIYVNC